jgi:putative hemolysin
MFTDFSLLTLILPNCVFAMSEIAIVGSKRARLLQMAEAGSAGARHARKLSSEPTRFLSSVQMGITTIGILNAAIGEASIASRLRTSFEHVPVLAPYAETLALGGQPCHHRLDECRWLPTSWDRQSSHSVCLRES